MRSSVSPAGAAGRRSFLSRIILAVHAVIAGAIGAVVVGAGLAPGFAARRRRWQRAAAVGDLMPDGPTPVTLRLIRQDGYRHVVDRRVVYIGRDAVGGVRVLDSTCTHLGCRTRFDASSGHFLCPCHGGVYDADGQVLAGPPPAPLRRLDARIDGDHVVVQV